MPPKKQDSKPQIGKLNVRIPDALLHRVKVRAAEKRVKLSHLVAELLERWLKERA